MLPIIAKIQKSNKIWHINGQHKLTFYNREYSNIDEQLHHIKNYLTKGAATILISMALES